MHRNFRFCNALPVLSLPCQEFWVSNVVWATARGEQ